MEISVSVGEWIQALSNRMSNAVDGDCFLLPTPMHLHAFETLQKQEQFVETFPSNRSTHIPAFWSSLRGGKSRRTSRTF